MSRLLDVQGRVRRDPPPLPIGEHLGASLERASGFGLRSEMLNQPTKRGVRHVVARLHRPFSACQQAVDDILNCHPYATGMEKSERKTTLSASLLFKWLEATGTSQADFGRIIGESDQNVNNWKRRGIPRSRVPEVAALMGIKYEEYEADSEGLRTRQFAPMRSGLSNTAAVQDSNNRKLPLISWVRAGHKNPVSDPFPPGAPEEWEEATVSVSKDAFALRVRGDSMVAPDGTGFPPESIIVIDPSAEARNGDYVVVRFQNSDEATFKRLIVDGPLKLLKPLNPSYPTIQVTEDARLAGVVVEHRLSRKFR